MKTSCEFDLGCFPVTYIYPKGAYRMNNLFPPYDFSKYICFLIKEAFMISIKKLNFQIL